MKERVPRIRLVCRSGYSCGSELLSHQGLCGVICGFKRGCLAEWREGSSFVVIMNKNRQAWTFKSLLADSPKNEFPEASTLVERQTLSQSRKN